MGRLIFGALILSAFSAVTVRDVIRIATEVTA